MRALLLVLLMACNTTVYDNVEPTCDALAEAICEHIEACSGQMLPACRQAEIHACVMPKDIMACQNALDRMECDELDRGLPEECK